MSGAEHASFVMIVPMIKTQEPEVPGVTAVVVVADDLSGACETAAALGGLPVLLGGFDAERPPSFAVDLSTREASAAEHTAGLRHQMDALPAATTLFVKTDSLLRGHLKATLQELVRFGRPVLFSPALPELRRHVRAGTVEVDGVPLHQTDLWARELQPAPTSISELLGEVPHQVLGRELQPGDLIPGQVTVCDIESPAQADRIADIARIRGAILVGASALARALAVRSQASSGPQQSLSGEASVLVVVGSAAGAAIRQLELLCARRGLEPVIVPTSATSGPVEAGKDGPLVALGFEAGEQLDPELGPQLLDSLGVLVARLDRLRRRDLVLIGGETAREILGRLGVRRLDVVREVEPGAVVSIAGERLIATRPGSFGAEDSLLKIVDEMKSIRHDLAKGTSK